MCFYCDQDGHEFETQLRESHLMIPDGLHQTVIVGEIGSFVLDDMRMLIRFVLLYEILRSLT